jgi:hypothetical protein
VASILKPIIHLLVAIFDVLLQFFTVHFAKTMTATGILIAIVLAAVFVNTRK